LQAAHRVRVAHVDSQVMSWRPRPRITALAERKGRWSRVLVDRTSDVAHMHPTLQRIALAW